MAESGVPAASAIELLEQPVEARLQPTDGGALRRVGRVGVADAVLFAEDLGAPLEDRGGLAERRVGGDEGGAPRPDGRRGAEGGPGSRSRCSTSSWPGR